MALSDDFLRDLCDRATIESVVSPYVAMKKRGRTLVGLCPFHSEKTPSFTVYPESNSFYCFGCGAGGTPITFVSKIENLDFIDAVKSLAQKYGVSMPEDGYDDTLSKRRSRILSANREAARFFHQTLFAAQGKTALDYLIGRNLSMQTIKHFGMGFSPDDWHGLLNYMRDKGYSAEELFEANLIRRSDKDGKVNFYDNFRNRVMVPIIDLRGNVVAFGGRVLDDSKPKYVNTSDTLVYKKSKELFALNFAKNCTSDGRLILAEGYMDVIALHQAGFTYSVAGLGTALTDEQAMLLSRYADEVVLSYDSDEAGQKAARRAISVLSKTGLKIKLIKLTGGKDPDEIIKKHGKERFQSLIDGAANDTEYKILAEREKYDVATDDGKLNFLRAAVAVLASLDSAIEKDIYASRLASEFSINKDSIIIQINEESKKLERRRKYERISNMQRSAESFDGLTMAGSDVSARAAKAQNLLLSILLNNPDFCKKAAGKIEAADFSGEFPARLYKIITERVSQDKSIEPDMLSGSFTPDEMGKIVKLHIDGARGGNSFAECEDCINVILSEKLKGEEVNPATLGDEEWANMFRKGQK